MYFGNRYSKAELAAGYKENRIDYKNAISVGEMPKVALLSIDENNKTGPKVITNRSNKVSTSL